jgi:recombination protein RecA
LIAQALDRAIKALNLVLQAGGFGLVAIDLADVPLEAIKRLPFTTWLRLQRVLEGTTTACVLVAGDAVARSAGGVSIRLSPRHADQGERASDPAATSARLALSRPRSGSSDAFHAAVRASRRPFSPRPQPIAAGRWTGPAPHARRFRGLSSRAAVIRAERRAQSDAHVSLDFGE